MSTVCFDFNAATMDRQFNFLDRKANHRSISATAQEGTLVTRQWNHTYGGSTRDWAFAVIQTVDGGFVLAGNSESYLKGYYLGTTDTWLVKTDFRGAPLWNRTFGGVGNALAVTQTADGGFAFAGYTESYEVGFKDGWLMKTDAYGMIQWNRTFGGPTDDWAQSIIQTVDGGFALTGITQSLGRGGYDVWLVKTDIDGYTQWTMTYGGLTDDWAQSIIQTVDGGFVLAGYSESYEIGLSTSTDAWLVKTDLRGVLQWDRTYGDSGNDKVYEVIQTFDGGFAFVGSTKSYGTGSIDFWLVKTNPRGVLQWNCTYGGSSRDEALAVIQTVDGGFILAGRTMSYGAGATDAWLLKTDHRGVHKWNHTYGGPEDDWVSAVIQTVDGGFALTGYTGSYGADDFDTWLVKFVPIPETTLTTVAIGTTPESSGNTIVTTLETPHLTEVTPEFESFFILLTIPFLLGLRRKLH